MILNKIKYKQDCIHNSTVSLSTHRDTDKFTAWHIVDNIML